MAIEAANQQSDLPFAAMIHGKSASVNDALTQACNLLAQSIAPTFVGLDHLTLEAQQAAITAAQLCKARIALPTDLCITRGQKVWHQASPLKLPKESPCVQKIQTLGDVQNLEKIPDTLNSDYLILECNTQTTPQTLSAAHRHAGSDIKKGSDPFNLYLILECDAQTTPQALSAAHRYAGAMQTQHRVAVWEQPDKAKPKFPRNFRGNFRGLIDQLLWITGINPQLGGIDFAKATPTSCPPLQTLLARQAVDLLIHVGKLQAPSICQRIAIDEQPDPQAAVSFSLSPMKVAARIMLADTTLQWQCDDPTTAPADPMIALFKKLGETGGDFRGRGKFRGGHDDHRTAS